MKAARQEPLPDHVPALLKKALREIMIGAYESAYSILNPLGRFIPVDEVPVCPTPNQDYHDRLRLATLLAEVADYRGDYARARIVLHPYGRIVKELQEMHRDHENLDYEQRSPEERRFFRQKLYYLWQRSVWRFREGPIARSRELLDLAIVLARRFRPASEPLLTQLYYGAGKLSFHEFREHDATAMYMQTLMSASQRLDVARRTHPRDSKSDQAFISDEEAAARYSVARTLALGLGQCLREQGRLNEAHADVMAATLTLGDHVELTRHARLHLGSIERSMAGENNPKLLAHASEHVIASANYFQNHKGEVGFRARLELALITMQQKDLEGARKMLEAMLPAAAEKKQWLAECQLALSRVARRRKAHQDAMGHAREAVAAAADLVRIRRRAQVVLVLAMFEAATDSKVNDALLKDTLIEINRALEAAPDIRTRANMLLTKARVLKTQGEVARALEVFRDYERIEMMVEVGRIHELAARVKKELEPDMNFQCLADQETPDYDIDRNVKRLKAYLLAKAERNFPTKEQRRTALGRSRSGYHTTRTKLENLTPDFPRVDGKSRRRRRHK